MEEAIHVSNVINVVELMSPQEGGEEIEVIHRRGIEVLAVPLMHDALCNLHPRESFRHLGNQITHPIGKENIDKQFSLFLVEDT